MRFRTARALGFAIVRARSRPAAVRLDLLDAQPRSAHLTSIARLPVEVAASLAAVAASLPGSRRQYAYPVGDLHLTIANLDAAHRPMRELLASCRAVAAASRPFPVRMRGVGMTAHSLYAQVWDDSGALWRLRGAVADAADADLAFPRRFLGFVNLLRFRDRDVEELRDAAHSLRRADLGSFEVAGIEVVRTDKLFSAGSTTVLARLPLGATAGERR